MTFLLANGDFRYEIYSDTFLHFFRCPLDVLSTQWPTFIWSAVVQGDKAELFSKYALHLREEEPEFGA